jgi:IS5 family transposase
MPQHEISTLQPVCQLFAVVPDTRTAEIVAEALCTLRAFPEIERMIEADLDRRALQLKARRMADAEWERARIAERTSSLPRLSVPAESESAGVSTPLRLETGRRRTDTQLVFLALTLHGIYGSVTDGDAVDRILESTTLAVFCLNRNIRRPDRTTLLRHINAISNETREAIVDIQFQRVKAEGLDDFEKLFVDSTAVEANTRWPTDSGLILRCLSGVYHSCLRLPKLFALPHIDTRWCEARLKRMHRHDFHINTVSGKGRAGKRRKVYRKFYNLAEKLSAHLRREFETVLEPALGALDVRPSMRQYLQRVGDTIRNGLSDAARVLEYSRNRVLHGIGVEAGVKILSLSDGDVAFIQKGDRPPVIGYKPQIARTGNGFLAALSVSPGNTADVTALQPLLGESIRRSGVVPTTVSTDDGYSSRANRLALQQLGVVNISFSGAKGQRLTPEGEWDSEALSEARRERSAIESMMFVLKHDYLFGRMRRRGIEGVRAEMLAKVIAFNFERMILVRQRKAEEARRLAEQSALAAQAA